MIAKNNIINPIGREQPITTKDKNNIRIDPTPEKIPEDNTIPVTTIIIDMAKNAISSNIDGILEGQRPETRPPESQGVFIAG